MPFEVQGVKELQKALGDASKYLDQAFDNIGSEFSLVAEGFLIETLIQAAAQAGPEAFPIAYIEPMLEAAKEVVTIYPGGVGLDFEALGTADELAEGFHYGAKIAGGGQVDLPYGGDALKNDTEGRYYAWLRVFHGDTWHGIDYAGSWNETIAARLSAWGDKAPQWLLLEYGQEEWEPTINPFPIVENVTTELFTIFEGMLRSEVEQIVAGISKPIPSVTQPKTQNRDSRGRFSRGGN